MFCTYFALFATNEVGRSKVQTGIFVSIPFRRYTHWSGKTSEHLSRNYHVDAAAKAESFIAVMRNPTREISVQLDSAAQREIDSNRRVLVPIIETIIFLARCGIPLRGHRDSGRISCPASFADVETDQGNFRGLLQFRAASGDSVLACHLASAPANAVYVSPRIQSDLIGSVGYIILRHVVDEVNEAGFFSVLADETTDVAGHEQLTVVIRYVFENNIREQFICFARADDLTGEGLAHQIMSILRQSGINCSKMIGQGYDGASSMSGVARGVQAIIRQSHPAACYVHCAAHALNLTISKASEVQAIRNAFGVMCEVVTFFRLSPKRSMLLERKVLDCQSDADPQVRSEVTHLKKLCDTRWVERHEAVKTFKVLYLPVVDTLTDISQSHDATSATASTHLASITRTEFVIAMVVLNRVLAVTKQLSVSLQEVNIDLTKCLMEVQQQTNLLQKMRADANSSFAEMTNEAETLLDEPLQLPRICGRQRHRDSRVTTAESAEQYYRRTLYIPFLDSLIVQFEDRFLSHMNTAMRLNALLPAHILGISFDSLSEAMSLYLPVMAEDDGCPDLDDVRADFVRWQYLWQDVPAAERPSNCLLALAACDKAFYPHIHKLLQIFASLPVSTATPERTFSAMKILKTYLRSRLTDENMQGLSMAYIHKDISVDIDKVIDHFSLKNRRLQLC